MNDALVRLLRARAASSELWIEVSGPSMRPTIADPASVRVVPADRPRLGEVWAFVAADDSIVVHRCLRRFAAGWCGFRGDGEPDDDPPVSPDRLVGRADRVVDRRGERTLQRATGRVVAAQLRRARTAVARRWADLPGRRRNG